MVGARRSAPDCEQEVWFRQFHPDAADGTQRQTDGRASPSGDDLIRDRQNPTAAERTSELGLAMGLAQSLG